MRITGDKKEVREVNLPQGKGFKNAERSRGTVGWTGLLFAGDYMRERKTIAKTGARKDTKKRYRTGLVEAREIPKMWGGTTHILGLQRPPKQPPSGVAESDGSWNDRF